MLKVKQVGVWFAIVGIALAVQGCWEKDEDGLTLLGEGGCRTSDGGDGQHTSFPGMSEDGCKAQCLAETEPCTAVEFNSNNGSCEIHSQPVTKFEAVQGVSCYVVK
jgi:hypothetical protein